MPRLSCRGYFYHLKITKMTRDIELGGFTLTVHFDFCKGEPQTHDHPGNDPYIEQIRSIKTETGIDILPLLEAMDDSLEAVCNAIWYSLNAE